MAPRLVKSFLDKVKGKEKSSKEPQQESAGAAVSASQVDVGAVGASGAGVMGQPYAPGTAQTNYPVASEYGQTGFYAPAAGTAHGPGVNYGQQQQQAAYGQQAGYPQAGGHAQQGGYGQAPGSALPMGSPQQASFTQSAVYSQQANYAQQPTPYTPQSPGQVQTQAQYPPATNHPPQRKPVQSWTQAAHHPPTQQTTSPSTPLQSAISPMSPSTVSPQTPTVTARVTIPEGTSNDDAANMILSQIVASIVTAQNSCPVHEQCDSSCPRRIGISRYRLLPSGERVDEADMRLQASAQPVSTPVHAVELPQPATIAPTTPLFRYTPLENPKVEIRLLKIKPAYARAEPLDLELVPININDAPAYGALSYCWGNGPAHCKLLCNDSLFMARSSLEMALKRIRAGFTPSQREEYIWADAICIDQTNEAEKSHQIMLMRYIYSRAQTVYIDLGDIKGRSLNFAGLNMTWGGGGGGMGRRDLLTEANSRDHPLHYKTVLLALTQPWFGRTWIIQEVTLAKRARFMFQGNVFERDDMDSVLDRQALLQNPERMQELLSNSDTIQGFMNYNKIKEIKQLYQQQQNDSLKLIQLTRDFLATEPKDKIYGLLALMSEYDQQAMGPYSQSLATLFRRFAALHVRYGRAITMLDSAGIQRRQISEYLPSWVPDWTAQSPSPKVISTLRPIRYAAGGPTISEVALAGDETGIAGLSIRGYLIDSLVSVHEMMIPSPNNSRAFVDGHARARPAFDAWLAHGGGSNYPNPEEAFVRLLLMDDTYQGANAIPHSSPIASPTATYKSALDRWSKGVKPPVGGRRMDAEETFQMQAETACLARSFAITRNGHLALVPLISRPGDEVVVFWGATVPHIIRRGQAGFTLVGDGYVQGIMEGEGVAGLEQDRLVNVLLV